ncbi:protocadherin Fat 4-like [Branchiostoma floridae]|uniref:Protocadherin Fat 4-like n=1 Tax=Branchiostoma floridae TaxID=7739 RepID=A0A9J7LWV1_BRAFL|nr:protocadherin Fat 4-like [Branchiostoma floridae]
MNIDECVQSDTVACQVGCSNTLGGYLCTCGTGFFLTSDQVSCQDLDECARNTDNCQQRCTNTVGSFVCACNPGYVLLSDRRTCQLQPTMSTVTVSSAVTTSLSTDRASTITTSATQPGVTSVFISPAVSRSTGVPPVVLPDEPECGTDCHVQARFLTIGNREQCVCNPGWKGNGTYCELAANGFNLRLRMKNISFVDELNNCSSQEFQDLWPIVFRRLDSYYRFHQNSRISDNYLYCNLQLFLNGSVIAYHTATFKEDSLLTRDDVAAALSQAISADTANTLGFDPASPGVQELCYRSYCMNGGSCVESGSGDRTCKCPVGFAGIRCERRDDTGLLTRIFGVLGAFLLLLLMVCLCRYWFLVQKRSSKTRYYVPRDSVLGVDSDTSSTTDDMVQRVGPTIFVGRYLPRRGFTNELRRSPSATNPDAHDERLYNEIFGKNDTFKIQRPKWSYLPISGPASTMGSLM